MRSMSPSRDSAAMSASKPSTMARDCAPDAWYDSSNVTSCPVSFFHCSRKIGVKLAYASRGVVYAPSVSLMVGWPVEAVLPDPPHPPNKPANKPASKPTSKLTNKPARTAAMIFFIEHLPPQD